MKRKQDLAEETANYAPSRAPPRKKKKGTFNDVISVSGLRQGIWEGVEIKNKKRYLAKANQTGSKGTHHCPWVRRCPSVFLNFLLRDRLVIWCLVPFHRRCEIFCLYFCLAVLVFIICLALPLVYVRFFFLMKRRSVLMSRDKLRSSAVLGLDSKLGQFICAPFP